MGFNAAANPFLWAFVSAVFLGASVSRATVLPSRARYPERVRAWKWVWAAFYLSFAILSALAGFFVSGPGRIASPGLLPFFLISAGVSFFSFRFKRLVGLPLVLLSTLFALSVLLFVQALSVFSAATPVAEIRTLSVDKREMTLEVQSSDGHARIISTQGEIFAPVVELVAFDDAYIFLAAHSYYRFLGIMTSSADHSSGGTASRESRKMVPFTEPAGIPAIAYDFFEKYESLIPGMRSLRTDVMMKKPKPFTTYDLLMKSDGSLLLSEQ